MADDLPRQVIREHQFERELRALISDEREADEFVEAAEFVLARNPEIGTSLGWDFWFMPMAPVKGDQISLYYTFDAATVTLVSIARV